MTKESLQDGKQAGKYACGILARLPCAKNCFFQDMVAICTGQRHILG